jgi:hypothetical protein
MFIASLITPTQNGKQLKYPASSEQSNCGMSINVIRLNSIKEGATDTSSSMDLHQKHAEQKKPDTGVLSHDSTFMTCEAQ